MASLDERTVAAPVESAVIDMLVDAAARCPDKVALVGGEARVTYGELLSRALRLAGVLRGRGVELGDRVAMLTGNTVAGCVAFWGILAAGAVVVPLHPQTKAEKLARLLGHCDAVTLVTEDSLASVAAAAFSGSTVVMDRVHGAPIPVERVARDALAMIIYTSGSTGVPKGVMLSQHNIMCAASSIRQYLQLSEHDVIHGIMPMSFDYGLYQLVLCVLSRARLVLSQSFALPAPVLRQAAATGVTVFPGVPTVYALLAGIRDPSVWDLTAVRMVTSTAAPLTEANIDTIRRVFPNAQIFSMYGITECKRCTYLPPEDLDRKPGSVGIAIPSTELWLVDEDDRRLGPEAVGQLVIRGPTVMQGYWKEPEATAQRLPRGPGVLYTGDLCRLDRDGYLYFVARMDDIIKSRGEKVAPKEIEMVLTGVPGVREAAVIGVPDEILGEAVMAFVVADAPLDEATLVRACRERLESYMVPRSITFVPELPRTPNGKVDKRALVAVPP